MLFAIYFAVMLALAILGLGITLSGKRIEVGAGSYLFSVVLTGVMLFYAISLL